MAHWIRVAELVGAARFELATPSPPDWCANQAALRSEPYAELGLRPAGHCPGSRPVFLLAMHVARTGGSVQTLGMEPLTRLVVLRGHHRANAPTLIGDLHGSLVALEPV